MSERDIVDKYRSDPISSKYGTDFILVFSESSEAVVRLGKVLGLHGIEGRIFE